MRRYRLPLLLLLIGLLPVSSFPRASSDKSVKETALRGRAVCVDEAGRVLSESDCGTTHTLFAFETADGRFYTFSRTDSMAAVFIDPRVRARELLVTARVHQDDRLEIIKVQSIKAGKLYDIYYHCDVCNITRNSLQLCPCCRDEMAFVETAARDGEP